MKLKSSMTGRNIDFDDNIIIVNPKQAAFYWEEKHIQPVHIYPTKDTNTGASIIVFVFQKSATKDAYHEWLDRR